MATKTQYDVFRSVYDEENTRYNDLNNRASIYLSLVTLLLGSLFFKLDFILLIASRHLLLLIALICVWLSFFGSAACTLLSVFIRRYEGLFDPEEVIKLIEIDKPTEAAFLDARIVDLAVATTLNSVRNEQRAKWLQVAGILLLIGFGFSVAFLIESCVIPTR